MALALQTTSTSQKSAFHMSREFDNKLSKTVTKFQMSLMTYLSLFEFSVCIVVENVFEKRNPTVYPVSFL